MKYLIKDKNKNKSNSKLLNNKNLSTNKKDFT